MWSKISNALKPRQGNDHETTDHSVAHTTDVLSRVYEQHPNMSVFHETDPEVPFPTPSPPPSPSKQSRRGMLKRISKISKTEDAESLRGQSPLRLPISLPKKVRSHMHLKSSASQVSLTRTSAESSRPSTDTYRQVSDPTRPSLDGVQPNTPGLDSKFDPKYGSVRSILRDPKTPGTGQNVRFFSRDAYKVISPNSSVTSEPDPVTFADRLKRAQLDSQTGNSKVLRPSAMEVFSPSQTDSNLPDASSLMAAIPPPELSNIFDVSAEHELPSIPMGLQTPLLDGAIELDNTAGRGVTSTPFKSKDVSDDDSKTSHDRSVSFSFGQAVFHRTSPADLDRGGSSDTSSASSHTSKNRNRALSDTVFQSMLTTAKQPEADINDSSEALVVYASPEPDPFRVNATTYYTPQTMIPPTPPQGAHSRTASREEDLIWSLRTQLALQQELCAQYEIDLSARDELVQALTTRVENAEKENEKRKSVLRSWKKKAAELEKLCRHLEEEVDNSRQESMERSIMDEASSEALRQLHRQISQLERERSGAEAKEAALDAMKTVLKDKDEELTGLRDALRARDVSEHALKEGIRDTKEQMEQITSIAEADGKLKAAIMKTEQTGEEERERHRVVELAWAEERQRMIAVAAEVQQEKLSLASDVAAVREMLGHRDEEYHVLKSELEAQWTNTERSGEEIAQIVKERDSLKCDVDALEGKISAMEEEWNESENRKSELETELQGALQAQEALEKERQEFQEQLLQEREHVDGLTHALQEQEDRLSQLQNELEFTKENVTRLQENIKERDAEIASLSEKVVLSAVAAEELQEQLSSLKREQARTGDTQQRELEDAHAQQREAREQLEVALKEKAITDITLGSSKERVSFLMDEVAKLRMQVHQLQQESADKEVTIVQLNKQKAQDKEDINGLNIALDSKQQELELMKRKQAVRGTGGATPAQPSKITSRRESTVFSTPSAIRPPSALSDVSKDGSERKLVETPSAVPRASAGALSKSIRVNAASSAAGKGSMGPPASRLSRPSVSGTPTPSIARAASALGRSASTRPSAIGTPATAAGARRVSSSSVEQPRTTPVNRRFSVSSNPSELDEKENISTPTVKTPRRLMVPS